ncbi:(d)CMP kinase [Woeseiaceae bacterium]|mgnify:FL=1|jgi:CMP/dCMP kinase|nr:(d)CMP kinase [Woeseiaceae bacterium]|tara:strand:+ start:689 stop:1360 length:672 start_codon:yes stop_codon:yes gene_type:complete
MHIPIITIDGPSGSGKGTISRKIASILGWKTLDSGSLYRIVAFAVRKLGLDINNESIVKNLIASLSISFDAANDGKQTIFLNEENITNVIRVENCGIDASIIARYSSVRAELMVLQRSFVEAPGLVADGRDMGTFVFPGANLKIFLTASLNERAKRRHKQLKDLGNNVSLTAVSKDISIRDKQDLERMHAPLVPASDACIIDSSDMSILEVSEEIIELYKHSN